MALDSGNVRLAPTGHVYVAPFGTALPTSATSGLNAAFKELGYIDENGVSVTPSVNTNGIPAWQAAVDVKTVLTSVALDVKFTAMEITQVTTAEFFFGISWTNSLGQGFLSMSSNPTLAERSMIIDWTDDTNFANRLILNRGIVTDRQDMQIQRTQALVLGMTFHVLDNNGVLGSYYSTNPDLVPAT